MRQALEQIHETTTSFLATVIGGLFLSLLYLVTFWLVVGTLAAIQVRERHDASTLPFAFTEEDRVTAGNYLITATSRVLAVLYDDPHTELYDTYFALYDRFPQSFPNEIIETYGPSEAMRLPDFLSLANRCEGNDEFHSANPVGCGLVRQMQEISFELETRERGGEAVSEREATALGELEKLRAYSEFVDLYDFFEAFGYLRFLQAPKEILVMLLTIVMGVLGSVITMTWTFVRRDNTLSPRRFLLLPFVGGMSAFTIFVFLKAGQLTLTAGESSDTLSPFFLSFVGIISGLLSERAYARMSEVGNNFFAVNDELPRWGIDLDERRASAGLSIAEMANYLKIGEPRARGILSGRVAADGMQQRLIAACLRADRRLLFTDLPPDMPNADELEHDAQLQARMAEAAERAAAKAQATGTAPEEAAQPADPPPKAAPGAG